MQVNIQAYLLWEQAGRPDGADFAGDARATLEAQARAGKSVEEIEAALKAPEPQVPPAVLSSNCQDSPMRHPLCIRDAAKCYTCEARSWLPGDGAMGDSARDAQRRY